MFIRSIWPGALLVAITLAAFVFGASSAFASIPESKPSKTGVTDDPPSCFEDDPCWHWPTMGNGKRGVVTVSGRFRIVGACGFAKLHYSGRLVYGNGERETTRLRGDRWARRFGPHECMFR